MGSFTKQIRISLHFLALSFIQLLGLQEATVLRLVWMAESTSEYSIRAMRYSSCQPLPKLILDQVLFPGNAGIYWEPATEIEPPNLTRCRRLDRKLIIRSI